MTVYLCGRDAARKRDVSNMIDVKVKPSQASDIPALKEVLDGTELFPSEMLAEMMEPALSGQSEAFWLSAHCDGTPVGLCFTQPEDMAAGCWNMLALAVLPAMQGQGVGRALVRSAEAHLQSLGQRLLIVDTSGTDDFALTRQFYATSGYEEEARIRDFWGEGDDKVIFRKSLK